VVLLGGASALGDSLLVQSKSIPFKLTFKLSFVISY